MNSQELLSSIVAYRTYCKYIPPLNRRETLEESINRTMTMFLDRFPELSRDIIKAFTYVHQLQVFPSMRNLQFAGQAVQKNPLRSFNCSALNITYPDAFSEIVFLLLSGTGVGFSVQDHHINQLPVIKKPMQAGTYLIQDSIAGWASAVNALFFAYMYNRVKPIFDYSAISPLGTILSTVGSKAPGPEPLRKALNECERRLEQAIGRKLRAIEVHDLVCILSDAVLSGGIRRSATISLFSLTNSEMLKCKSGNWWEHSPHRMRANNSVVLPRNTTSKKDFDEVFKMCQQSGSGEPGFSWTDNNEWLTNPCQPKYATLLSPNGITTMGEIKIGDEIWSGTKWTKVTNKWSTGIKPVFQYVTIIGDIFIGTENHKIVQNGKKIEVGKAYSIDHCSKPGEVKHKRSYDIDYVTHLEDTEVFDITVDDEKHTYWTGGCLVSNCHEISLQNQQLCNLTSVNQTRIKNEKTLMNCIYAATLIGTLQASFTDFPYLNPNWKETCDSEALIGVSFTGICDSRLIDREMLQKAAKHVLEVNERYAKRIGINMAARTTCIKPEGSLSAVSGSSSGIHARHSQYYLRRVQMNEHDALVNYLKDRIPDLVEKSVNAPDTLVVTIPQSSPEGSILRSQESALDLFRRILFYQRNWISIGHRNGANHNNVSATISVKDNEWEELKEEMWKHQDLYTGISLLPYSDSIYKQSPFEECTEETYKKLNEYISDKKINLKEVLEDTDNTKRIETIACSGNACEII